jgi:hypothetical protein
MNTILKGLIFWAPGGCRSSVDKWLKLCALVGIRTPNLLIRSEMLYPIELQVRFR